MHQYTKTFKINLAILVAALSMLAIFVVPALPVYAAASDSTSDISTSKDKKDKDGNVVTDKNGKPIQVAKYDCTEPYQNLNADNCNIVKLITVITNVLSAVAGVVIALMIVVGGIQYASAGANPQAVAAARGKVKNAIIALFLYVFMFSFLQWLIPGGVFG